MVSNKYEGLSLSPPPPDDVCRPFLILLSDLISLFFLSFTYFHALKLVTCASLLVPNPLPLSPPPIHIIIIMTQPTQGLKYP